MKSIDRHREAIEEINRFVLTLDPSIRLDVFRLLFLEEQKQSPGGNVIPSPSGRGISPQERIRSCNVSALVEKALVLGFWLEEDQKKQSFTSSDLAEAFKEARESAPGNPSAIVAALDSAGRLMKAEKIGKSQSYRLTQTGIEEVQNWMKKSKETES